MPTYPYHCKICDRNQDIIKSVRFLDDEEICEKCGNGPMDREIAAVQINTSNCQFQTHFNHAFGKVVKSKNQINDEVRRINGETGKNIVEVGNDNLQSVKKPYKKYDDSIRLGDFN